MAENQSSTETNAQGFDWKKNLYWIIGMIIILAALILFGQGKTGGWSSYPASSISDLVVDPLGQVWYSSWSGSEIYPIEGDPIPIPLPNDLDDKRIFALAIDEGGQLYIGSSKGLVGIRDSNGDWSFFRDKDPEAASKVKEIAVDGRGRVWIQTNHGLAFLDPSQNGSQYDYQPPGMVNEHIDNLSIDSNGDLWLLDGPILMNLGPTDEWRVVPVDEFSWELPGLSGETETLPVRPHDIQFDSRGDIWLASSNGFIHQLGGEWILEDFQGDYVAISDFVIDHQDRVWGGTLEKGVFLFEPDQGLTYFTSRSSGLKHNDVDHIVVDGEGKIWIDTFSGLSILDPQELSSQSSASNAVLGYQVIPVAVLAFIVIGVFVYIRSRPDLLAVIDSGQVLAGFIGWFVLNGVFWGVLGGIAAGMGPAGIALMFCFFVPLPANLILILILFKRRRWMAIGAFSAMAINSILILLNNSIFDTYSTPFMNLLFQVPFFLSDMLGF